MFVSSLVIVCFIKLSSKNNLCQVYEFFNTLNRFGDFLLFYDLISNY